MLKCITSLVAQPESSKSDQELPDSISSDQDYLLKIVSSNKCKNSDYYRNIPFLHQSQSTCDNNNPDRKIR